MFGDTDLAAVESSIKLQDQEQESTMILQQMGLEESEQQAYSSLPNSGVKPPVTAELQGEVRVPLTTKHGQQPLDASTGLLATPIIQNVEEPELCQVTHISNEEKLPKFKIDLKELK